MFQPRRARRAATGTVALFAAAAGFCGSPAHANITKTVVTCTAVDTDHYSPAITTAVHTTSITGSIDLLSCTVATVDVGTGVVLGTQALVGLNGQPVATGVQTGVSLANGTCNSALAGVTPALSGRIVFTWHDAAGGSSTISINNPLVTTVAGNKVFTATADTMTADSSRYADFKVTAAGLSGPVQTGSCLIGGGLTGETGGIQLTFTSP